MEDRSLSLKWSNYKITFFENLKILRESTNYTDATLAVEGKFYPVHKVVMSTCSEYFSDIFERTPCKSPVIVLKDVTSHDIEFLLDYMYLGEVSVHQNDLVSLLKTAECLKIKGLAVQPPQDKDRSNILKNSTSNNDDTGRGSPPPKRRRSDSKSINQHAYSPILFPKNTSTSLANPAQISSMPPYSTAITEHDECTVVEVKIEDDEYPEVEVKDVEIQDERLRENNYKGDARSARDSLGNYGSDLSKTHYEPGNDGGTSFPGSSLQQSDICLMEGVMPKIMNVRTETNPFKTNEYLSDSASNQNQTHNPNESVLVSSVKVNRVDKPKVSYTPIEQNQVYKGPVKDGSFKQICNVLQSTSAGVPAAVVAAVNDKGSRVYLKIRGDKAIRLVEFMNPKKGKVGVIKVTHCGQRYTIHNIHTVHNIPGMSDGSLPNYTVQSNEHSVIVTHNIPGIRGGGETPNLYL